jgi:hypothetical protein
VISSRRGRGSRARLSFDLRLVVVDLVCSPRVYRPGTREAGTRPLDRVAESAAAERALHV